VRERGDSLGDVNAEEIAEKNGAHAQVQSVLGDVVGSHLVDDRRIHDANKRKKRNNQQKGKLLKEGQRREERGERRGREREKSCADNTTRRKGKRED
jgi:hypothetical protein